MNLAEIKSFIQSELNYTDFRQVGATLELLFSRDKSDSIITLTLVDDVVKVVEIYESKMSDSPLSVELGGRMSRVRRFKSFKRLQEFLLLIDGK